VVDIAVVVGDALEADHDHVAIDGTVVTVDDRLIVIHHL